MRNRILAVVLSASLLSFSAANSQEQNPKTPSWVYIASAGSVLIMGSLWYHNIFKKAPKRDALHALKPQAESELVYLATSAERKAFKKIKTVEELHGFMADFWKKRDPDPATPENEVKQAYLRRLAYANASFHEFQRAGWQTARGRAYLLYGPPDEIRREPWENYLFYEPTIKALELWFYHKPTAAGEPPNLFAAINPGMVKFVFADLEGVGIHTQIYSSEIGEKKDARAMRSSARELKERY